jgi:hypothetical protein
LFQNLSFEEVDSTGAPAAWTCYCLNAAGTDYAQAACTTAGDAEHGMRALTLGPNCMAVQSTSDFDSAQAVRFDFFAAGAVMFPTAVMLKSVKNGAAVDRAIVGGLADRSDAWRPVASVGPMPTTDAERLTIQIHNATAAALRVDDIVVVQDGPSPGPKSGSLLRADHYESFNLGQGAATSVYTPLPIDYASQVPLYVEVVVEPPSAVDHVEYTSEDEGNWGAIVHFAPAAAGQSVTLAWQGVVLSRSIEEAERPTLYAANAPPSRWLGATAIADADYPPIHANAVGLMPASSAPLDRIASILAFTSTYITNATMLSGLDATSVWQTRDASCTGYANLGVATGRASGIPARHIVNILVGMSQDLHSIDEFYLGADLGWRRVEPQGTALTVAEDYGLIMRLVLPEDEGADALAARPTAMGGVPLHEFTEVVPGSPQITLLGNDHFADCPVGACLNHADPLVDLRDALADVKQTFSHARVAWQVDRAQYGSGGLDPARMAKRRALLGARTLAEVQQVLDTL